MCGPVQSMAEFRRWECGAETADETEVLSTSSLTGVGCPPESNFSGFGETAVGVSGGIRSTAYRGVCRSQQGFCGTGWVGRARGGVHKNGISLECPSWINSSPGRESLFREALGWTQLACTARSGVWFLRSALCSEDS